MPIAVQPYLEQATVWPYAGRHILAQYDDETIVVYQAYRPETGRWAAEHGAFGEGFSYNRMSWIKPNFLWMMYRSGWGTKEGQEVTLALRLRRVFFDDLLAQAVQATYDEGQFATRDSWQAAVAASEVRVQWDPDHDPFGAKVERRALQLGIRGETLRAFGTRELVEVVDLSEFVAEQRMNVTAERLSRLQSPTERVYFPANPDIAPKLGPDELC
ncbi:MAG: DUF4291 domain-containing protein [Pirellula sp.]|nr:DUF4291 domain-containing protein [Pirellula sp.]